MQPSHAYIPEVTEHIQRSLEQMPVRSSSITRQIVKAHSAAPETTQEIERYVRGLLTREEQQMCDMATD